MSSDDIINEIYEEARKEKSERFNNSMCRGIHPQPSFGVDEYSGIMSQHFQHNEMESLLSNSRNEISVKHQLHKELFKLRKIVYDTPFKNTKRKIDILNQIYEVKELVNKL